MDLDFLMTAVEKNYQYIHGRNLAAPDLLCDIPQQERHIGISFIKE